MFTKEQEFTSILRTTAQKSMPLKKRKTNSVKLPSWLTMDFTNSRKALYLTRCTNCRNYAAKQNHPLRLIRSAKMTVWRDFSDGMNVGTWGLAFNWAKNGSGVHRVLASLKDTNGKFTTNTDETTPSALGIALDDGQPIDIGHM